MCCTAERVPSRGLPDQRIPQHQHSRNLREWPGLPDQRIPDPEDPQVHLPGRCNSWRFHGDATQGPRLPLGKPCHKLTMADPTRGLGGPPRQTHRSPLSWAWHRQVQRPSRRQVSSDDTSVRGRCETFTAERGPPAPCYTDLEPSGKSAGKFGAESRTGGGGQRLWQICLKRSSDPRRARGLVLKSVEIQVQAEGGRGGVRDHGHRHSRRREGQAPLEASEASLGLRASPVPPTRPGSRQRPPGPPGAQTAADPEDPQAGCRFSTTSCLMASTVCRCTRRGPRGRRDGWLTVFGVRGSSCGQG